VFAGVEIAAFSGFFEQPREVVINKPFLFSIRDRKRGTVLFIGKVMDPSKQ
jgi:serine protease inhibitor